MTIFTRSRSNAIDNHLVATVRSAQATVLCLNGQDETCHDQSSNLTNRFSAPASG